MSRNIYRIPLLIQRVRRVINCCNSVVLGDAGNRNQKVLAAANYVKKSDWACTAFHPNVFAAAPFISS